MRTNNQILKLFPNVVPLKGYNRSLLVDLLNGEPHLVPNDLIDYLEQTPTIEIEEYEKFILDNELGILIDSELGECLTPLPLNYYPTSKINNAILELDGSSSWNLQSVLMRLDELGTQFLEVRFLDYSSFVEHLNSIQKHSNETTIEYIQIMVPFDENLKHFLDSNLEEHFFRLSSIVIYNASAGFELKTNHYNLIFTSQQSVSHENCGNISQDYFAANSQTYIRNRNYNSCLAYKISVDKDGFICNCPSIEKKYEHVDSVTFSEVIDLREFREKWELTKDKLLVCSVCEFRWLCTDCRAFTVDDIENGKPSKCTYNPFISLWAGEENYLSEKECGISFQGNRIEISEDTLNQINARIWG
ncbi:grasp-with-spasm system SPASM domain peptide maturase [Fluviicola taffensis]|uniref:grasp-with-spasm system SPASM domain peptide maturase n=1 Tax=Fluviicola taffensis TaxID=191579 RepID=UPI0031383E6C